MRAERPDPTRTTEPPSRWGKWADIATIVCFVVAGALLVGLLWFSPADAC